MRRFEEWFRAHQGRVWLITVVLLLALGLLAAAPRPAPTQWEYKVVVLDARDIAAVTKAEAQMSRLGGAGWRYAGIAGRERDRHYTTPGQLLDSYVVVMERRR
jgi:hypothetical protein